MPRSKYDTEHISALKIIARKKWLLALMDETDTRRPEVSRRSRQ